MTSQTSKYLEGTNQNSISKNKNKFDSKFYKFETNFYLKMTSKGFIKILGNAQNIFSSVNKLTHD